MCPTMHTRHPYHCHPNLQVPSSPSIASRQCAVRLPPQVRMAPSKHFTSTASRGSEQLLVSAAILGVTRIPFLLEKLPFFQAHDPGLLRTARQIKFSLPVPLPACRCWAPSATEVSKSGTRACTASRSWPHSERQSKWPGICHLNFQTSHDCAFQ